MEKEDIIQLIAERDDITIEEAREAVADCQDAINWIVRHGPNLAEVEQILMEELGLEPDYLLAFL